MKATALAFAFVLSACTSSDPDPGVVHDELLRPESPPAARDGLRTDQGDPARTGDCPQLDGQALRDCLERAQYMPKNPPEHPADPHLPPREPAAAPVDPDRRSPRIGDPDRRTSS